MRFQAIYRSALLAVLAGAASACWGWAASGGFDGDRPGAAAALIAGAVAVLLGALVWSSAASVRRKVARLRGGTGLEGRWFVGPNALAGFLEAEKRRGVANEWRPTRWERRRGVEILWGGEHLVVGGTYWRMAPGQYPEIQGIGLDPGPPPAVAMAYRQLWVYRSSSTVRFVPTFREFRFPAADAASARAMVRRLGARLDGPLRVDPRRAAWFFRGALVLAVSFAALGLVAFGIAFLDGRAGLGRPDGERAALIAMAVLGLMGTPAALAIAWLARSAGRDR